MMDMNPWLLVLIVATLGVSLLLLLTFSQVIKRMFVNKKPPKWLNGLPYYLLVGVLLLAGWAVVMWNGWQSHALNWLNLLVRWAHVIIGIAWIGASFYFVFLENSLNRTKDLRDELAGNLWAIHGGGFYYLEKYKNAPKVIPDQLHWFKYEAYFTWITGFLLLIIVYYSKAEFTMAANSEIPAGLAVGMGIGSLVIGWLFYHYLCRSKVIYQPVIFFLIMLLFITGVAYLLVIFLSPKAAYIHIGAMMGTMMAGNVFQVIIPAQKALVAAAKKGLTPDPELGKYAGLRSMHNNYFTLPVVFIMISNHFPSTFGHPYNWAILGGLILLSAGLRHYLNLQEKGRQAYWILPIVTLGVLVLAFITAPKVDRSDSSTPVSIDQVMTIFQKRCNSCHSANPTDSVWVVAPNGVMYDEPAQIVKMQDQIMLRVVTTETMPLANQTGMTAEERELIRAWIVQGAKIE